MDLRIADTLADSQSVIDFEPQSAPRLAVFERLEASGYAITCRQSPKHPRLAAFRFSIGRALRLPARAGMSR